MASCGAPPLALRVDGEIDHHDGVLLHHAEQHDDAHEGVQVQFLVKSISVSSAPKTAEGRPERIVMGWMKLSYKMPSTM